VRIARTYNTVRYLRPVQITNRVKRQLWALRTIPAISGALQLSARRAVRPAKEKACGFDGNSFRFLNVRYPWFGDRRWNPDGAPRLWIYNLHYFEYLWGLGPADAFRLLDDWIACNTDIRSPGWEPYPLSLRIREWIEWLHAHPDLPPSDRERLVRSIASQVEALSQQVEWHLLGNHIAENAITLCWAGLSFSGPNAEAWLKQGYRIVQGEMLSQVLNDDVHDERSPMYQALLVHALLRLAEVAGQCQGQMAERIRRTAGTAGSRLLHGLRRLVHPDGDYALVNDCALGVAPTLADLERRFGRQAAQNDRPQERIGNSGYATWRDNRNYLVFDSGPLGPDHQPGHGHADALSFEFSYQGQRLITDTGIFTYAPGSQRAYDRSTAAHNTIALDDRDQCDLWESFRCGSRSRVAEVMPLREAAGQMWITARCDWPGREHARHTRSLNVCRTHLAVKDEVVMEGVHSAVGRLHFAPDLDLRRSGSEWELARAGVRVAAIASSGGDTRVSTSLYHPQFNCEFERYCLETRTVFRNSVTFHWRVTFV